MKLYATVTDSHGKKDGRGDNEYLEVLFNERNNNKFLVAFDGNKLMVLDYSTGERTTLEYAKGERQKGEYSYLTSCRNCKQRLEGFKKKPTDEIQCGDCGQVQ